MSLENDKKKKAVSEHFNGLAQGRERWQYKNRYYYQDQQKYFRFLVPESLRVLEIGCGLGDLLAAVKPGRGLGIDLSDEMVKLAQRRHPHIEFRVGDADALNLDETFDVIILSDVVGHLSDVETALRGLRQCCTSKTRLIISYYNFLWEPLLDFSEKLGFKMPQQHQNWLTFGDIQNLLHLAGYEMVKTERRLLWPKDVPLLSWLMNNVLAFVPGINSLCLSHYLVARKIEPSVTKEYSCSIVIPCRNELGNVEAAIMRMPSFSRHQEIIFVDGHSTDGTVQEINRVIGKYPGHDIKLLVQDGTGKGDAVRRGFTHAQGDILMILDSDLTVPPEDLPKFYHAIASGKGEFINGCRLVYPMETEAMRFLNLLGNKFFSMAFSWLLNQRIKDTLCGTKVLFRKDYERLVQNRGYFGNFDPFGDFDLLFGASKLNLKIIEMPIRYQERRYGTTNIRRFAHGWLLLKMTVYGFFRLKAV
jgi:ubiquinone/menaquinone biosynthesis C-methylase UbiE